jgi:hypothetical protein
VFVTGVAGTSTNNVGVYGQLGNDSASQIPQNLSAGVFGAASPIGSGVIGWSAGEEGEGVWGLSYGSNGVLGSSEFGAGVCGFSPHGIGVQGSSDGRWSPGQGLSVPALAAGPPNSQ